MVEKMRDPHVDEVHYEITTGKDISFSNPPEMDICNHLGRFKLVGRRLSVYPTDHFADGTQARAVIDPFLRAWELYSDLTRRIGAIRFEYKGVKKVDRAP